MLPFSSIIYIPIFLSFSFCCIKLHFLSVASWAWECPANSQAGACQHKQGHWRHHDKAEPRDQGSAGRGDIADCDERGFGRVPSVPGDEGNTAAQGEETGAHQCGKDIIVVNTDCEHYNQPFAMYHVYANRTQANNFNFNFHANFW